MDEVRSRELDEYFEGRPGSRTIFDILAGRINALGDAELTIGSQISFGRQRKFAWFWIYNVTMKNPSGVPHLMLALDRERNSERVRTVSQIGKNRWNDQIVVRTEDDARSRWMGEYLALAYEYGGG
jgi:hypothetical protein